MNYLIDTNILIYHLKNVGNVSNNFIKNKNSSMFISVITFGEMLFGAKKSQQSKKNIQVVSDIKSYFPIINITSEIMETFSDIKAYLNKIGKPTDDMDLLIAATAISHNLVLVTHNTKHFSNIPTIELVDWY